MNCKFNVFITHKKFLLFVLTDVKPMSGPLQTSVSLNKQRSSEPSQRLSNVNI